MKYKKRKKIYKHRECDIFIVYVKFCMCDGLSNLRLCIAGIKNRKQINLESLNTHGDYKKN